MPENDERISKLEDRMNAVERQAARSEEKQISAESRIEKLEGSNRWVITSVLAGVFSVVASKLGIGQ